jgi:hypothetical protein
MLTATRLLRETVLDHGREVAHLGAIPRGRVQSFREFRSRLDERRLVKGDAFYRPPQTDGERKWLTQNRPEETVHWNLLTDLRPEHLPYANGFPA